MNAKPISESSKVTWKQTGWLVIFELIFFCVGMALIIGVTVIPWLNARASSDWLKAPCTIVPGVVQEHRGDEPVILPNENITGTVQWSEFPEDLEMLEVRLVWYTIGRGDRDAQFVEPQEIETPATVGQTDFEFTAPHRPNSFEGQLIAFQWAIEVIVFPQRAAEQSLFRINPPTGEIVLASVAGEDVFRNQWSFEKKRDRG